MPMNKTERPLSPHLSVYRWPITMTLSILHRMTGVALSIGLVVFVAWLQAMALGAGTYETAASLLDTVVGRVLLVGFTVAFFFHFANGIRHLFWDLGLGFELRQARASAWAVVAATILMSGAFWMLI